MRKKYILLFILFLFVIKIKAQIYEFSKPFSDFHTIAVEIPEVKMPDFNVDLLIEEDKNNLMLKPYRFAKVFEVDLDTQKDGIWIDNEDYRVWMISIKSKNAFSLSLTFSDFELKDNVKLYVYNKDKSSVLGAFTSANNNRNKTLTIRHIQGDEIIIELVEPISNDKKQILKISSVSHDYRDILKTIYKKSSGDCEVDISCEEGIDWQTLKKSVVKYTYDTKGSTFLCTGTFLTNTALDYTPYLLSAEHCISAEDEANSAVFYFNYEAEVCEGDFSGDLQTLSGANLKATWKYLDFCLLELNSVPPENFTPYYSGWDISNSVPEKTYCIHHPGGDVKKISIDENPAGTGSFEGYMKNSHWQIFEWEVGATEGGSSGAPLFNSEKRIIGTLTGGEATCNDPVNDYFQKIKYPWNEDTAIAKQLKYWLDPYNSDLTFMDSYNPFYGFGIESPKDLSAEVIEIDDVELNWIAPNLNKNFENENFENYPDFSLCFGNWTQYDFDKIQTCSVEDFDFKNETYIGSGIIFNSNSVSSINPEGWEAHSGNKYLAFFAPNDETSQNNNWLITPKIHVENKQIISFWAKSVNEKYTLEKIKVAISNSTKNIEDFKFFDNEIITEVPNKWTKYSFDLSDYENEEIYFAINIISENSFCLLVDDIEITDFKTKQNDFSYLQTDCKSIKSLNKKTSRNIDNFKENIELTGYQVYRNFAKIADLSVNETSFLDTNLLDAKYIYYITAVYDSLISYPSNQVSVFVDREGSKDKLLKFGPNPTTEFINIKFIDNEYIKNIKITDINGKTIQNNEYNNIPNKEINISNYEAGVYIIEIETDKYHFIRKFVKL